MSVLQNGSLETLGYSINWCLLDNYRVTISPTIWDTQSRLASTQPYIHGPQLWTLTLPTENYRLPFHFTGVLNPSIWWTFTSRADKQLCLHHQTNISNVQLGVPHSQRLLNRGVSLLRMVRRYVVFINDGLCKLDTKSPCTSVKLIRNDFCRHPPHLLMMSHIYFDIFARILLTPRNPWIHI